MSNDQYQGPEYGNFNQVPPFAQSVNHSPYPPRGYCPPYMPPRPQSFFASCFKKIFGFFFALFLSGFLFFIITFVCLCILGGILASFSDTISEKETAVVEKTLAGNTLSSGKIAILPIEGLIDGKEDGFVRKAIRQATEDPRIKGIVLRVNSPGGTISGSDYYYYLLKEMKKEKKIPIVVSMGSLAASGGYYVSMVGDKIYAERSTMTGSIGVIIPLYNAADLCNKIGISSSAITSGPMKGMGDFTKPMKPEEKEIWQSLVDQGYKQFLDVVREGRPIFRKEAPSAEKDKTAAPDSTASPKADSKKDRSKDGKNLPADKKDSEKDDTKKDNANKKKDPEPAQPKKPVKDLETIADGRIYSAQQAKDLGLIDEIGFTDDAVRKTIEMAGLLEGDVHVVRYKSTSSFMEMLETQSEEGIITDPADIAASLLKPEAYYLCPRTVPIRK
ncbi:MAG: signal peptide peptidase SppA [Planctomycetia bacterium]|nr:signal peptide peptidase SppA [Planctomycetia bacterium]